MYNGEEGGNEGSRAEGTPSAADKWRERPEIMRNGGWEIVQSHEIGQKLNSKARPGHAASEHRGDPHTKA